MITLLTINDIIKGRKNDYYINKKLLDIDGNNIGYIIDASVNKKFKRVYCDVELFDEFVDDNMEYKLEINKTKNKKRYTYTLVVTKNKIKRKYKKKNKLY
jgi:hypothetical protein